MNRQVWSRVLDEAIAGASLLPLLALLSPLPTGATQTEGVAQSAASMDVSGAPDAP